MPTPDEFADPEHVLDLVQPVLDLLAEAVAVPQPGDLHRPTPCTAYDLTQLRDHVLGWLQFFAAALSDPDRTRPRLDPAAYRTADDPRDPDQVVRDSGQAITDAIRGGVLGRTVPMSQSMMDGPAAVGMVLGEYVLHGWDLARTFDRPWNPPDASAAAALAFLSGVITPEYRNPDAGGFGAEIPVPADAPVLDRLLGFTGRDPAWTPAGPGGAESRGDTAAG